MSNALKMLMAGSAGEPPDENFENTVLLLHGDGTNGAQNNTFLDSSTNNFTITRNGNTTQGTFSPFSKPDGRWGNYFVRASSSYLTVSNAGGQFSFGTGAFTIECWVNLASMPSGTGYPASYWLFGGGPFNSNPGIDFYINNTQIGFNLTDFLSPTAIGNHGMLVGNWYHVAVVRGGSSNQTLSIYVNGTRVATASSVTATADAATSGIAISAAEPSGATSGNFDGYISNYRIVKGTAVYDPTQTTLTVPTGPLTAISGTSLLTCQTNRFKDNSANNFTVSPNGSVSVTPFSPFPITTAYDPAVNGGSGYFDGSGDYLTGNTTTLPSTSTSTFTIEAWVNPAVSSRVIIGDMQPTAGNVELYFGFNSSMQLVLYWFDGSGKSCVSTSTLTLNAWNYVAARVSSNAIQLYVNSATASGVTGTTTLTNRSGSRNFAIGSYDNSSFNGYMSNIRVSTVARTIAVPTAPFTSDSDTRLLLNFTNAGIFDNTGFNNLETVGNAQIDTSVKKYGTGAMKFDGSGDGLRCYAGINAAFGTGDFTIEMWFYIVSFANTYNSLYDSRPVSTNGAYAHISIQNNGKIYYYVSSAERIASATSAISTGTWYHIAVARSGTSTKMFLDGTQIGSTYTDSTAYLNNDNRPMIGTDGFNASPSDTINGYIDDLRITKGIARYTSNFTPPDKAFADIGV